MEGDGGGDGGYVGGGVGGEGRLSEEYCEGDGGAVVEDERAELHHGNDVAHPW